MPEFESQGYQGLWMPSRRLEGQHGLLVVIKRSWRIDAVNGLCEDDGRNDPIRMTPVLEEPEQPATSNILYPSDTAPEKARVDVLVSAEACAPGGTPTPSFEVGVTIADVIHRSLRVIGPRRAVHVPPRRKKKGSDETARELSKPPRFTDPEALSTLPLTYTFAYGGAAAMHLDDAMREAFQEARASPDGEGEGGDADLDELPDVVFPANPAGRGFCIDPAKEAIEALSLPQIESLDEPLTPEVVVRDFASLDLEALTAPVGFAPFPVSWFPRAAHAGVMPWDLEKTERSRSEALDALAEQEGMDEAWIASAREQPIPVMKVDWYQDAHPDLQAERVLGDERVTLDNLTRHGKVDFELPGRHPWPTLRVGPKEAPVMMTLDTLHFDLVDDADPRLHLVWRGFHPLPSADAVAAASDATVEVRDLPQPLWLVRRQELLEAARADEEGPARRGTRKLKWVGRDEESE